MVDNCNQIDRLVLHISLYVSLLAFRSMIIEPIPSIDAIRFRLLVIFFRNIIIIIIVLSIDILIHLHHHHRRRRRRRLLLLCVLVGVNVVLWLWENIFSSYIFVFSSSSVA